MPSGPIPWLFIIPPLIILLMGVGVSLFSRSAMGRARADWVRRRWGLGAPDADESPAGEEAEGGT